MTPTARNAWLQDLPVKLGILGIIAILTFFAYTEGQHQGQRQARWEIITNTTDTASLVAYLKKHGF